MNNPIDAITAFINLVIISLLIFAIGGKTQEVNRLKQAVIEHGCGYYDSRDVFHVGDQK